LAAGLRSDQLGSLSGPPDPLPAVKGLGPPGGEGGKGKEGRGEGRKGKGRGGRGGDREGKGEGMAREGREEGTGRGPQFKKNDPRSSDGWLQA